MTETIHAPVSEKNRIKDIDVVRGFALFGVLLVNAFFFKTTYMSILASDYALANPLQLNAALDRTLAMLVSFFAEGKFYPIFPFLFGLGCFIFTSRAEEKGLNPKHLFKRRMFLLFVFGLLNLVLVWWGDILHIYALVGLLLMYFLNKPLPALKRWAIGLLVVSVLLSALSFAFSPLALENQVAREDMMISTEEVRQSLEIMGSGSFLEIVVYRLTNEIPILSINFFFVVPKILAMFLIGVIAGKLNVFGDIQGNRNLIHRTWRFTGLLGAVSLLVIWLAGYPVLGSGYLIPRSIAYAVFFELGTVLISLFYITSLVKLLRKEILARILSPLQYMGRMALTNYLVQCVVCSLIFYGHGLGYMGRINIAGVVLFSIVFFALQIVASAVWFRYFKFGPLEYAWRKFTYARVAVDRLQSPVA